MMKITDFFEKIHKQYCPTLINGKEETISKFFTSCIAPNLPKKEIIEKWDTLLKDYIKDPEAIFFIRRYASGKDKETGWNIRRGFLTECKNIKYVYVDNFFAQYFFAMAINNFVPSLKELKEFILERKIPYGYMAVSKELPHQAYHRGAAFPLNSNGWKLSHVYSANQNDYSYNYKREVKDLFPKGEYGDYKKHSGIDYPFWKRDRILSNLEIAKIKAHFLRVVHPINHFLTPMSKFQTSDKRIKDIGENKEMIAFMQTFLKKTYGKVFTDYQQLIMAKESEATLQAGATIINLTYGPSVKKTEKREDVSAIVVKDTAKKATASATTKPKQSSLDKFNADEIAGCVRAYLFDGYSFRDIEHEILEMEYRERGGGFVAQTLMRDLGLTADKKGYFKGKTLDEAIKSANESLLLLLQFVKKHL